MIATDTDTDGEEGLANRGMVASVVRKWSAPSSAAKVSALRSIQKPSRVNAVYNCRPLDLYGPPIQIYHPVFASFIRDSLDTRAELTPDILDTALHLINSSLWFYKDELRRRAALVKLRFWGSMSTIEFDIGKTAICPNGVLTVEHPKGNKMVVEIVELKNEIGEGGSDPIMQAERSYASIVCSPNYTPTFNISCCPAFLVGIAGPNLVMSGAIFSDKLITQRLTDYIFLGPYPSGEGRTRMDEATYRVAHILHALKNSTDSLKKYYEQLDLEKPTLSRSALVLPDFRIFSVSDVTHHLTYTKHLAEDRPHKAVFQARIEPGKGGREGDLVVVKFADSYCKAAHELLAGKSLAPNLWFCDLVPEVGLHVVVMDYVEGSSPQGPCRDREFVDKLQNAIHTLHACGFVHGDLREPNVLVPKVGGIKIIDFDWCGEAGTAQYPSDINLEEAIGWHETVTRGGKMEKKHDERMFFLLTGEDL